MALIKPIASITLPLGRTEMTVHAAGVYDDPLRPLIMAKLHRQTIAAKHMAHILWERISKQECLSELTALSKRDRKVGAGHALLVPVPLHWTRFAWRGYNQAELIARELSKLSGIPMVKALRRVRATSSQTHVPGSDRLKNVRDVFVVNNTIIKPGSHIIIIDDLMTTGATLIEAARAVEPLKPARVDALVVARALKI